MLNGPLLGWKCPIQWAASLENEKKNRNKTSDYRLKTVSRLNGRKMTKPFLSPYPVFHHVSVCFYFHLINTKTVSKKWEQELDGMRFSRPVFSPTYQYQLLCHPSGSHLHFPLTQRLQLIVPFCGRGTPHSSA
jgi:hypothetical protein